ncbi:MAG: aldehyde dehydrogenase family protein [Alphaproteobacteria bacterium]|nr:aldehyde dehydrogenase family protein [Alphaproteobacteria bacterium]
MELTTTPERERHAKALAARLSGRVVVDGTLRPALTDERFPVENPATGEAIGMAARCGQPDVERAVAAAAGAFAAWATLPHRQRSTILLRAAAALEAEMESLACLSALETGNAIATQTRGEARTMVDILRYFAGFAGEAKGKTVPLTERRFLFTRRVPVGVVGAIIPWNAPLMQTTSKLGPALAAGNTVVLKSAEQAPLAVLRIFEILQGILPPGVANVITGFGEEAGRPLAEHPQVRKVTFTGSSAVGARLLHYAADKIVPVTAELGGKNPNIVLPDADLELAVAGIVQGLRLFRQGQSCTAGTRVYIHAEVYDEVIRRTVVALAAGRMGNPLDESTQVGSIISREQFERVERYVAIARATPGARILTGGARPDDPTLKNGYFYLPTLIDGIPADSPVCRDEIFGPVATVAAFTDFEAVLREANDSRYGLAAVLWTRDLARAMEFVDRIEAGFVQINQFSVAEAGIEYGGTKLSGMGREMSPESMVEHFTWPKTVIINYGTPGI